MASHDGLSSCKRLSARSIALSIFSEVSALTSRPNRKTSDSPVSRRPSRRFFVNSPIAASERLACPYVGGRRLRAIPSHRAHPAAPRPSVKHNRPQRSPGVRIPDSRQEQESSCNRLLFGREDWQQLLELPLAVLIRILSDRGQVLACASCGHSPDWTSAPAPAGIHRSGREGRPRRVPA